MTTHTEFGRFRAHYRELARRDRLRSTPLILSEGDSWFSLPLYANLVDWLALRAPAAVFLRLERSGDRAIDIFSGRSLRGLTARLRSFDFDVLLLSAGGNDFVGDFLRDTFRGTGRLSVHEATRRVVDSGRFEQVLAAWQRALAAAFEARPGVRVVTHGYDYPRLLGTPIRLSVAQIGLVALFKRSVGDWIGRHLRSALPDPAEQAEFSRQLIDAYHARVLAPLKKAHRSALTVVDLRGMLDGDAHWNDEMHPTAAAFERLSGPVSLAVRNALPAGKRAHWG